MVVWKGNKLKWRQMTCYGDPWRQKPEKKYKISPIIPKDLEIKCLVADFRLESIRQILIFKTQHVLCLHSVITQAALSDIIFAFDNAWLGLTSLWLQAVSCLHHSSVLHCRCSCISSRLWSLNTSSHTVHCAHICRAAQECGVIIMDAWSMD